MMFDICNNDNVWLWSGLFGLGLLAKGAGSQGLMYRLWHLIRAFGTYWIYAITGSLLRVSCMARAFGS